MTNNSRIAADKNGNIIQFQMNANTTSNSVDLTAGVAEFRYYESVLSNNVTATAAIVETGFQSTDGSQTETASGTLDSLPIRGGERTDIIVEDAHDPKNRLDFGPTTDGLYVNRVRDADPGTQKDVYFVDFASKEYFSNDKTRVVKKYEGKISDNIQSILDEVLVASGESDIDETALPYNFIGCDRKPFHVCTWLASKSVPVVGSGSDTVKGPAGFLFYQTRDGFSFKSIDSIFNSSGEGRMKKYIFNNTGQEVDGFDDNILNYSINRDIDLHENLILGTYMNRSLFLNPVTYEYNAVQYSIEEQKETAKIAGREDDYIVVAPEFIDSPSRIMTHIKDVGGLPSGVTSTEQLENWKEGFDESNFDSDKSMVQSIMRYNQLFSIQIEVMIRGDFSLKAGQLLWCDFRERSGDKTAGQNPKSGGIYMIASVCHRMTQGGTYSSLSLVRDSFGKKPQNGGY